MAGHSTKFSVFVTILWIWVPYTLVLAIEDNGCPYDGFGQLIINKADYVGKDTSAVSTYCLNGYFVFTRGLPNVTLEKNERDPNGPISIKGSIGEKRGSGVIRKTTKVDHVRWDIVNPSRALEARNGGQPVEPKWIVVRPPPNIEIGTIWGERKGDIIYISSRGGSRISRKLK